MFSERTARYVTDWVGNWQRINIKSQSECYYYDFIVVLILQY